MIEEIVKPNFYYNSEADAMIVDCQYSKDGNRLALSYSNGSILVYNSHHEINYDEADKNYQCKYSDINQIFMKIAWGFSQPNLLAAVSIKKQILCFSVNNDSIQCLKTIKTQLIPIFICFYPSLNKNIISVGFSGGGIGIYSEKLKVLNLITPHLESVNWLSWQHNLYYNTQKNKWVAYNFPDIFSNPDEVNQPYLVSCSSDRYIKIWTLGQKYQLFELLSLQAHNKQVRQVVWKPLCFNNRNKYLVSSSDDTTIKIWSIVKKKHQLKASMLLQRSFHGAVLRCEYNQIGTVLVIRFYKAEEQKIVTKFFKEQKGVLTEQIKIDQEDKLQN